MLDRAVNISVDFIMLNKLSDDRKLPGLIQQVVDVIMERSKLMKEGTEEITGDRIS